MATDATGTPTAVHAIPKINPSVDAPSGGGTNAAMDAIDTLLNSRTAVQLAGTHVLKVKLLIADAVEAFQLRGDGMFQWGAGGAAALDVNLYRSAADVLKTDDTFHAMEGKFRPGASGQVRIGDDGTVPRLIFGSAEDTNLYRNGASVLKTDDQFQAALNVVAAIGTADQVNMGLSTGGGMVTFGSAQDTNLYRSAANTLKTDDSVHIAGNLTVDGTLTGGSALPSGVMHQYGGTAAPTGYLLCNGDPVNRTTYAALFAVIGTSYGAGDGSTTFNVPDLRGRIPVGKGTHADVDALADNDGAALADRRPGPGVTSGPSSTNQSTYDNPSGLTTHADTTHTHTLAKPSFLVVNYIIKT